MFHPATDLVLLAGAKAYRHCVGSVCDGSNPVQRGICYIHVKAATLQQTASRPDRDLLVSAPAWHGRVAVVSQSWPARMDDCSKTERSDECCTDGNRLEPPG